MTESPAEKQPAHVPTLNIANVLTTLRILMVPFFIWALVADEKEYGLMRWVAVAIFAVAMYTDKLDGDLARSRGLITNFGKIADPIADKLLTGSALVMFSILAELPWWITLVILVREWGITLLRFVVIRYGVMAASRGGKLKTVLQIAAIIGFLLPLAHMPQFFFIVASILMAAAVAVTVYTGVEYMFVGYRAFTQGKADKK